MSKYKFYTIILCISIIQVCNAQNQKWSLEKCISYAKENNLQLKQLSYDAEIAGINLNTTKNAYLPEINAGASQKYNLDRTVNPYTHAYSNGNNYVGNLSVNAGVDIFQGFQRKYNVQKSEFTLNAVLMDIEEAKNNLSLNIASVFLEILYYDELIKSNLAQLNESKHQVGMANEVVNSGIKTVSYLYDFLTQMAQDSANLVIAKNKYQSGLIDLIQLLDIESIVGFEIEKPASLQLVKTNIGTVDDYVTIASSTLPQLKSAKFRLNSAESNLKYIQGNKYPSLSFVTYFGTNYSSNSSLYNATNEAINYPYFNQLNDNINMYFGLNLSIPVFNKFNVRNSVSLAKINKSKAAVNIDIVQQQIYKEVQKAYYDLSAAREKMMSIKALFDATTLSYNYTNEKLKAGVISVYDYSAMKTKFSQVTSDYLQSKYEYIFKMKILDFYTGTPITLEN
ncbi:MAG: TolC family protein [Salinivirgaceae bacterium]|nr:TolC family protein [Salinivirgaceae bacterium]